LNIIEAKNETFVIGMKNDQLPNYTELNNQEHKWSAIYYCFLVWIITISTQFWILPLILLLTRRLFFQEALNKLRGKGYFYLSDRGIDGWFKKQFGEKAGKINALICGVGIIVLTFIYIYIK